MTLKKWASDLIKKIQKNVVLISDNQITPKLEKILDSRILITTDLVQNHAILFEVKILDGLRRWFMTITDDKKRTMKIDFHFITALKAEHIKKIGGFTGQAQS
jgi:hypothetical protein